MKIGIVLPIYISTDLHIEFTEKTLESIKSGHEVETYVVATHVEPELENVITSVVMTYSDQLHLADKGNILGAAWNQGINYFVGKGVDYILIPNNDIIFHPEAIDNLVQFAEENKDGVYMWTANEYENLRKIKTAKVDNFSFDDHPHFSCFMVSPNSVNQLADYEKDNGEPFPGMFDENFKPAYFEDNDMHTRILRSGMKALKTASAMFYHFGSRTIKSDDELDRKNKRTYEASRAYFIDKWGWDPHGRAVDNNDPIRYAFSKPFNK